jgi:diphosphomevalonate decarboxylase
LVKYWGKVHEDLIIPANSSLSITIDQGDLCSRTVVELRDDSSPEPKAAVRLILNGREEKITKRVERIIGIMRERTCGVEVKDSESGELVTLTKEELLKKSLVITSENNFATASGLASSSSGLSCLSFALA